MSEKIDNILKAFLPDYARKLHVRQIARMVGMNRQTASETLRLLERSRVLDSEISGKQKLYFINKGNVKAKLLVEASENSMRLGICEKKPVISRLVEYAESETIAVLFGSYSKGTEKADSDIDVLIISSRKSDFEMFEKETGKRVHAFQMGKKKFLEGFFSKDHLIAEIVRNHVCLRNTGGFVDIMWRANYGKTP